jgi:UDP-glucuronate decarboxylase
MRILITGGAGFLGSHLCRRMLALGHWVTCVDSFVTGSSSNLRDFADSTRFRLVRGDVTSGFPASIGVFDRIYNLACPASPPHYQKDPVHTTLTNVVGIYHALELADRCGARILQASTSEVYGDPECHPQTESYRGYVSCTGPRACYDEGKRCAESLMMDYARTRGVEVRIARIFNTYGPFMSADDGRVVSNFIVQALKGTPLTVYGDGDQTRSLCYVDDMIDGLIALMEQTATTGPVNLGNPEELTVLDIARRIVALVGRGKIVHAALPVDDPRRRKPDTSLAQALWGFHARVPFEEGARRTVRYFTAELGRSTSRVRRLVAADDDRRSSPLVAPSREDGDGAGSAAGE